jgi:hypothetical protein
MMNDPTVLEAARVLAANLLAENTAVKNKIYKAFRLIVCRRPNDKELAVLTAYYQGELKTTDSRAANKLLNVGEYPLPVNADKVKLAVLMKVMAALYNLEETIVKT